MISISHVRIIPALLFSFFFCTDNITAKPLNPDDLWYEVHAKGKKYGYLNLRTSLDSSSGVKLKCYESELYLKFRYLLFFTVRFKKQDKILIDPLHGLLESSSKVEINEKQGFSVTGRLDQDVFQLTLTTAKGNNSRSLKRDDYDYTELDVPVASLEFQQPQKYRIISFENGKTMETTFNWVRSQKVSVEGDTISCKVIEFKSEHRSGQRWITPDSRGIMIYEEGTLGKWPYRVMLASKEKH
jgi:hypothetical protein